jgi:hypothetical protein
MSFAWYLFFSTISLLYYYICNRLLQRAVQIKGWLKNLKKKYKNQRVELKDNDSSFYEEYNSHHSIIKKFSKYWNFVIFLGFILFSCLDYFYFLFLVFFLLFSASPLF